MAPAINAELSFTAAWSWWTGLAVHRVSRPELGSVKKQSECLLKQRKEQALGKQIALLETKDQVVEIKNSFKQNIRQR